MLNNTIDRFRFTQRQWLCVFALMPVIVGIYFLAYWLRFDGELGVGQLEMFASTILWVALIKFVVFAWFRIYQGWGRYTTFHDLLMIIGAATCGSMIIAGIDHLVLPSRVIPRSVVILDWGATVMVIGGLRAASRLLHEWMRHVLHPADRLTTLIVGANDSGEALLRAINRSENLTHHVVGFIDDDVRRKATRIGGVPVIGTLGQTSRLAQQYGATEILINSGELTGRQVRKLVEDARRCSVKVKVLPSYEQLVGGSVAMHAREVSIEDLLRRDPVRLDMKHIQGWINNRVVMVTGSAGSIGSEICRQLLQFSPRRIVMVDRSENGQFYLERQLRALGTNIPLEVCIADLMDDQRVQSLFDQYSPNIVFHAAAYKHVPLMESNPGEAIKNIVLLTRHLADIANKHGVRSFVMISTDKAVNPKSVMGACKRVAELYIQSLAKLSICNFVNVRFGNVLDSAGSVVPIFREQIAEGGPVTVTDPRMVRYFMTIPEASQLVIQAGAMGTKGETFVLDMGEPVHIVDLAADMIRLSGLRVDEDIEIEFTGLRPGEKLTEELYDKSEKHHKTTHEKIMVAEAARPETLHVIAAINRLESVMECTSEIVKGELQKVISEFHHEKDHLQEETQQHSTHKAA